MYFFITNVFSKMKGSNFNGKVCRGWKENLLYSGYRLDSKLKKQFIKNHNEKNIFVFITISGCFKETTIFTCWDCSLLMGYVHKRFSLSHTL